MPTNLNEILFWTERDALENDETSRGYPLGTETFDEQLAELILPALTTVTWRIQYLALSGAKGVAYFGKLT